MEHNPIEGSASGFHIGTSNKVVVTIIAIVTLTNMFFSILNYKHLVNKDKNEPYEIVVENVGNIQASLHLGLKDSLRIQLYRFYSIHYGKLDLLETDVRDKSLNYYNYLKKYHVESDSSILKEDELTKLNELAEQIVFACEKVIK